MDASTPMCPHDTEKPDRDETPSRARGKILAENCKTDTSTVDDEPNGPGATPSDQGEQPFERAGGLLGLASRSPLTLLDEPYLGLDVTARTLFHRALLRDVGEHPRTILLSTHLVDESEALFDRVVILERGRVRVDSAAEEIS